MPFISIIVPVYNVEQYLAHCLDSLIHQPFQDIEIICVNDGSTDQSPYLLSHYQQTFPHLIQVIHLKNSGLSAARNAGLKQAKGEYICFIDSDDWIHPSLLDQWSQLALQHQADIVTCGIEVISESGKSLYRYGLVSTPLTAVNVSLQTNEVCNKLYHRHLLTHFEFPIGQWYEDLSTVPLLLTNAHRIVQWNEVGYYYFQRQDSITKTYDERVLDIILAFQTLSTQLGWNDYDWHRLVAKHLAYTLIRIASIPSRSQRLMFYQQLIDRMTPLISFTTLRQVISLEGLNAKLLVGLWSRHRFILLDGILQIEIRLRHLLRKMKGEFQ